MGKVKGKWDAKSLKSASLKSANGAFSGRYDRDWGEGKVTGYTSNGMRGFTENGPDEGFDLALGTVRGYRWWTWKVPARLVGYLASPAASEFGRLTGAYGCAWEDGKAEAQCSRTVLTWRHLINGTSDGHEVPEYRTTCGCGFWAFWPPDSPSPFGSTGFTGKSPVALPGDQDLIAVPVFGSVRGSGRVILGDKGFRSQFAQIESLCLPPAALDMIGWWDGGTAASARPGASAAVYNALVQAGRLAGRPGYAVTASYPEYARKFERAGHGEVVARAAMLEAALEAVYPSARILSGQETLTRVFPPEPGYYRPEPPSRRVQF